MTGFLARIGASAIDITLHVGGIVLLFLRVLRTLFPWPTLDGRELWRNMYRMGVRSVPIIVLTAFSPAPFWWCKAASSSAGSAPPACSVGARATPPSARSARSSSR